MLAVGRTDRSLGRTRTGSLLRPQAVFALCYTPHMRYNVDK